MINRVGIRADLEQGTNERLWAMIDRIFQARSDGHGHVSIREVVRVINGSPQGSEVAVAKSRVDSFELFMLCGLIKL